MDARSAKREIAVYLKEAEGRRQRLCLIHAPIFNEKNISDGYIQRVKAIDDELLNRTFNIYIDFETKEQEISVTLVDERHLHITLKKDDKACLKLAIWLARKAGLVYTHSVMRGMPDMVGRDILKLYRLKNVYYIWDVHGSVPEEFRLDDNFYEAQNAGRAEELFIRTANTIIVVNGAMKEHLEKKYSTTLSNVVVLPIFSVAKQDPEELWRKKQNGFPVAVYAGGIQKWQNIELMQQVMKKCPHKAEYKMFVSRPDYFKEMLGDTKDFENIEIDRKSPQQVLNEYLGCHYGFVLRDDITVNNVACPTKLIEYLQYGIVPVVKTEKIGDFVSLGMKYITAQEFVEKELSFDEYLQSAKENIKIIDRLNDIHSSGISQLKGILNEKFTV